MAPPVRSIEARIEQGRNIDPDTGCWLWPTLNAGGYGQVRIGQASTGRRVVYAHRVSYETFVGPIPDGLTIDHLCRNRACCNPDHLEPVTSQVNVLRGLTEAASHAAQTHCIHGHQFTTANTHLSRDGRKRTCRTCAAARARARRAREATR